MGLFSSSKESFLGVDIGTASIKIVELARVSGRPSLSTYGYIDIATDIIRSNTPAMRQKIVESLKKAVASSGVKTNQAIAALPTFSVFNSIITLPAMPSKDLASAVKWEAKKYVPLPLEEMILDWKILSDKPKPDKKKSVAAEAVKPSLKDEALDHKGAAPIRVLVTAAPKNLVSRYIEVFKQANLKLLSLETEAFALARSLIGQEQSTVMIVDLGSLTTDICIIEKGVPVLNRSLDAGGLTLTAAIAASLNINIERAEQFKRDFGVSASQDANQKGIPKTIVTSLAVIVNEIKYVFDLYQSQASQTVEKIILSGGSAWLPNLSDYFSSLFNKPAIIGNPWEKIIYPSDLKPILDEVGPRMAIAIGLAMRDI